jgi:CRISPR-associated protein Cmr2
MMHQIDYHLSKAEINSSLKRQKKHLGETKKSILRETRKGKNFQKFYPTETDLEQLPENSTLVRISFKLRKPYTSKGEGEFHIIADRRDIRIIENPIVRDKFLGCPMVRPSTWKGHIRFAAEKVELPEIPSDRGKRKIIVKRLFGSKPEDEDNLKGRLHFYPTFFNDDAERDIITPLDRETRTPVRKRSPIPLEVMKAGKSGDFYLLYVPYPRGNDFREKHLREDLTFLVEALELMFYTYGFSAKKTSGFGVIEKQLDKGVVWVKTRTGIKKGTFSEIGELISRLNELWGV